MSRLRWALVAPLVTSTALFAVGLAAGDARCGASSGGLVVNESLGALSRSLLIESR